MHAFTVEQKKWHRHLFQGNGLASQSRPEYNILASLYEHGGGITIFFKAVGQASSLHYTVQCSVITKAEVALPSLSRGLEGRHPITLLMGLRAKMEVASPSLSRRWARHPHLTALCYAFFYRGGDGILTSFKKVG